MLDTCVFHWFFYVFRDCIQLYPENIQQKEREKARIIGKIISTNTVISFGWNSSKSFGFIFSWRIGILKERSFPNRSLRCFPSGMQIIIINIKTNGDIEIHSFAIKPKRDILDLFRFILYSIFANRNNVFDVERKLDINYDIEIINLLSWRLSFGNRMRNRISTLNS